MKEELWFVWSDEDGVVCVESRDKAFEEYESVKERYQDYVIDNGEFSGDEHVIIGRVEHQLISKPTGVETGRGDEYWAFFEDGEQVK